MALSLTDRIIAAGQASGDPILLELGWSQRATALYHSGEVMAAESAFTKVHSFVCSNATRSRSMGIDVPLVALALWPMSLLQLGEVAAAEQQLAEVVRLFECCMHLPTLCCAFAQLACETLPFFDNHDDVLLVSPRSLPRPRSLIS